MVLTKCENILAVQKDGINSLVPHMYVTIIKPARGNVKAIWLSPWYCVAFCFSPRF